MAGYFYAMNRSLYMRKDFVATVIYSKWVAEKKNPVVNRAAEDVMCRKYWKSLYLMFHAVYSLLKLLRITYSNKPGMYKLYFLTSQTMDAVKKIK